MGRPSKGERDDIMVRVPKQIGSRIRELAEKSSKPFGEVMTLNDYCAAVLAEAARSDVVINEVKSYEMSSPLFGRAPSDRVEALKKSPRRNPNMKEPPAPKKKRTDG